MRDSLPPDEALVAVEIWRVCPWPDISPTDSFLVCLQADDGRVLPVTIGEFEGKALCMARRGIEPPRPLPYNLLEECIRAHGGRVRRLVVHAVDKKVFRAYLDVHGPAASLQLDCRPSDGMVLAALLEAPIFVCEEVMASAGRSLEDEDSGPCGAAAGDEPSELKRLQARLDTLVEAEDYEGAAKLRDRICRLKKRP